MLRRPFIVATAVLLTTIAGARAATVSIAVADQQGRPVRDAVVTLVPVGGEPVPSHVPEKGVIAQRNEMFAPLVVVIRQGGTITFTNNDTTIHQVYSFIHQVYSFSEIKQFAFEVDQGKVSQAVPFAKAGVAAIGCNIHDQMIAYVYVANEPFAALTDVPGRSAITDVPTGPYRAVLWQPRLAHGATRPSNDVKVDPSGSHVSFSIALLPDIGMKHIHVDY